MDNYDLLLAVVGAVTLAATVLSLLLAGRPLSFPLAYVGLGLVLFSLPINLPRADPIAQRAFLERISELAVIVALMGPGLKLDRPFGWSSWRPTWRLLGIAMPVTIVATGLLCWWFLGVGPGHRHAARRGGVPDRPSARQRRPGGPARGGRRGRRTVHPHLRSRAQDGLALPFTNAAIAAAAAGGLASIHRSGSRTRNRAPGAWTS